MVRVLLYCGGFQPIGGVETLTKNLIDGLGKFPVSIDLLAWGKDSELLRHTVDQKERVRLHRSFWRWGCRYEWPDWLILPRGKKLLAKNDIVFFPKLFSPRIHFSLDRMRLNRKPPFVFIVHYRPSEMWPESLGERSRNLIKNLLNTFDAIVVPSKDFMEDLGKIGYEGKCYQIPLAPPAETPIKPFPGFSQGFRLGFLGRLEKQKNLEYLLRSFAIFQKLWQGKSDRVELHFFGEGQEGEHLNALTMKLGLEPCVRFHGGVPYHKVAEVIDSCHGFVFSSVTEGQCLAALEILSRGRPLIATPVGSFPDIIDGKVGKIASLKDPVALAAAMKEMLEEVKDGKINPATIRKYYDKRYSHASVIEQYYGMLMELVNDKN